MKKCYIISYDMASDGDYDELYEAIKEYKTWAHITESTWAVVTEESPKQIRGYLGQFLPKGSRLFVVKSGSSGAWRNVICRSTWLKENL